jgi:hypothetical protein
MPYGTLVITYLHPAPAVAFACRGAFGQSKDAMDSVDLLRCVWLVLVTGAAYGAVILRRAVLGQKHPLDWPVDLEVSAAVGSVAVTGERACEQLYIAQSAEMLQSNSCIMDAKAVAHARAADDGSWIQGVPALGQPCNSPPDAQLHGTPSTLFRPKSREGSAPWLRALLLANSQVPTQRQQVQQQLR